MQVQATSQHVLPWHGKFFLNAVTVNGPSDPGIAKCCRGVSLARFSSVNVRLSSWFHRVLIAIGCGCLAIAGISLVKAASFQETAARNLEQQLSANTIAPATRFEGMVGRLEIPRLNVSVIVMEGDDDATLARAAGHVRGTALPWDPGNAVIAGHRDSFFRPLKDLREGDEIRMTTVHGTFDYRVTRTEIVKPDNVSVMAPTPERALTLVTCYPFFYIGNAPKRFVIHAR